MKKAAFIIAIALLTPVLIWALPVAWLIALGMGVALMWPPIKTRAGWMARTVHADAVNRLNGIRRLT